MFFLLLASTRTNGCCSFFILVIACEHVGDQLSGPATQESPPRETVRREVRAMGIKMERPPSEMSLADLAVCCAREMACYRRKEPCNDRYCLEIFHRAVAFHNEE